MSLRPLASLSVKMLGLYAFINALPTLPGFLNSLVMPSAPGFSPLVWALLHIVGGALQMLVGIALWWFSDGIARSAVPEDGDVPVRRDEGLTGIGFSVVGAYLLSNSVVKLAGYATNRYVIGHYGLTGTGLVDVYTSYHAGMGDAIAILVQGALGLYLLLGAQGLVRGLMDIRNVGRDREMESEVKDEQGL